MFTGRSVEVVLRGGLGNQMFQYALARTLSDRLGLSLVIDSSMLGIDVPVVRRYELRCFRLNGHHVRSWSGPIIRTTDKLKGFMHSRRFRVPGSAYLIKERSLGFQPEILQINGPCRLEGYWQSEKYFESISGRLRQEFAVTPAQDERSAECTARIRRVKSIGLHVRRGDFVTHPVSGAFHGVCAIEYYDAALKLVLARLGPDVELFVFSDDMRWTRENIRFPVATTYVDWNAERNFEDLRLMSYCDALVIANSSFSWWAGWLNQSTEKLVIAPRRWFREPGTVSELPNSKWLIAL